MRMSPTILCLTITSSKIIIEELTLLAGRVALHLPIPQHKPSLLFLEVLRQTDSGSDKDKLKNSSGLSVFGGLPPADLLF